MASNIVYRNRFAKRHSAFNYILVSDNLPTYEELPDDGTAVAKVKLFVPWGAGTWYIAAFDPDTNNAYGWCDLGFGPGYAEFGSVNVDEMAAVSKWGMHVERDIYWAPSLLSEVAA